MSRCARQCSGSGYYHIIIRGVNKQNIFEDDSDRMKFLKSLVKYKNELNIQIIEYCLMTNHVHILLKAPEKLDEFVKKLSSSYVYYFNHKYERCGHLFQDRFKSERVDNDQYLLAAASYILRNPLSAGIAGADEYRWNSWRDIDDPAICDMQLVIDLCGGSKPFKKYVLEYKNESNVMEYDRKSLFTDEEAANKISELIGMKNLKEIQILDKSRQLEIINMIRDAGISNRQITRLLGISRYKLARM